MSCCCLRLKWMSLNRCRYRTVLRCIGIDHVLLCRVTVYWNCILLSCGVTAYCNCVASPHIGVYIDIVCCYCALLLRIANGYRYGVLFKRVDIACCYCACLTVYCYRVLLLWPVAVWCQCAVFLCIVDVYCFCQMWLCNATVSCYCSVIL